MLCDRGKVAVFTDADAGYGSQATATFIHRHTSLLACEIQAARSVWLKSEQPSPDLIGKLFPEIRKLCIAEDVLAFVAKDCQHTPLQAAGEIMEGLFPRLSADSVERMGRRIKKGKSSR